LLLGVAKIVDSRLSNDLGSDGQKNKNGGPVTHGQFAYASSISGSARSRCRARQVQRFARSASPRAPQEIDAAMMSRGILWRNAASWVYWDMTGGPDHGGGGGAAQVGITPHTVAIGGGNLARVLPAPRRLELWSALDLCVNQLALNATDGAEKAVSGRSSSSGETVGFRSPCPSRRRIRRRLHAAPRGEARSERLVGFRRARCGSPTALEDDVLVVVSKTNPGSRRQGASAALSSKRVFKRLHARAKARQSSAMRGSSTSELVFDGCESACREPRRRGE